MELLKVPGGQDLHELEPSISWNLPAVQALHWLAPSPLMEPFAQGRHLAREGALTPALKVPGGQFLHLTEPRTSWKVPGRQSVHTPAPRSLKVPLGHAEHAPSLVAPSPLKKVPDGQRLQEEERDWS